MIITVSQIIVVLKILVMTVHNNRSGDSIMMVITDNSGINNTSNDST